jgi:hypothetical protein
LRLKIAEVSLKEINVPKGKIPDSFEKRNNRGSI